MKNNIKVISVCSKCGNTFENHNHESMCPDCAKYYNNNSKLLNYQVKLSDESTVYVDKEDWIDFLESSEPIEYKVNKYFPYLSDDAKSKLIK